MNTVIENTAAVKVQGTAYSQLKRTDLISLAVERKLVNNIREAMKMKNPELLALVAGSDEEFKRIEKLKNRVSVQRVLEDGSLGTLAKVEKLQKMNIDNADIVKLLNVTEQYLQDLISTYNSREAKRHAEAEEIVKSEGSAKEKILALHKLGFSSGEITDRVKVHGTYVYEIIRGPIAPRPFEVSGTVSSYAVHIAGQYTYGFDKMDDITAKFEAFLASMDDTFFKSSEKEQGKRMRKMMPYYCKNMELSINLLAPDTDPDKGTEVEETAVEETATEDTAAQETAPAGKSEAQINLEESRAQYNKTEEARQHMLAGDYGKAIKILAKFKQGLTEDEKRVLQIAAECLNTDNSVNGKRVEYYVGLDISAADMISEAQAVAADYLEI